ncbi:hypothetical protein LSTR_LSTR011962 [Laodelphax striatellus]|uniref:DM10 domain-containing protein n=1 Tax=Laodelphax striatellus TaxID=195883 RepID=A0A482WYQ9_LAOST|nr:hypothetical protein LSTR_LSTR011962 [Laodelphax striatellus]
MAEDAQVSKFSFMAEWYDTEAFLLKKFLLFFFPFDSTLELYDLKNRRIFLKRTTVSGVRLKDLFIGNTVEVYSRQLKIIDYGDETTRSKMSISLQKTFGMIKPDGLKHKGNIFRTIYNNGFLISKLKMAVLSKEQASHLYEQHRTESFFSHLIEHVTSGPVIAMELIADRAIANWSRLVGPTDPLEARRTAPKSIRACFGESVSHNAIHRATCEEHVQKAIDLFFPTDPTDIIKKAPSPCAKLKNTTCCIIKPCAVKEGKLGDIVSTITENGFEITAMQMFFMDRPNAEEFYEVYKGVVNEYQAMVNHMISGPCIAMEISAFENEDTAVKFRELAGPADPDIARKLRPNTIRARFGKDKIENAIHVTDLPDDAPLEVIYFFKILSLAT